MCSIRACDCLHSNVDVGVGVCVGGCTDFIFVFVFEKGAPHEVRSSALSYILFLSACLFFSSHTRHVTRRLVGRCAVCGRSFYAANCQLNGTLPSSMSALRNLQYGTGLACVLASARPGNHPVIVCRCLRVDRSFDVSGNALTGTLPFTISALTALTSFSTCGNQFSGTTPSAVLALPIARWVPSTATEYLGGAGSKWDTAAQQPVRAVVPVALSVAGVVWLTGAGRLAE